MAPFERLFVARSTPYDDQPNTRISPPRIRAGIAGGELSCSS